MAGAGPVAGRVLSFLSVESRKAWRNREASAVESVMALLEALRNALGADAVGLVDDDRADPDLDSPAGTNALNFWEAFDRQPCDEIDWDQWYRQLRTTERAQITCGCPGAHHLHGFLIHARWALLLVAPPLLDPSAVVAIASSLRALADRLPPARSAEEAEQIARYDSAEDDPSTSAPTTTDPRALWVRKLPQ